MFFSRKTHESFQMLNRTLIKAKRKLFTEIGDTKFLDISKNFTKTKFQKNLIWFEKFNLGKSQGHRKTVHKFKINFYEKMKY